MTDLVFVYGSLMSTVPSHASHWLTQNATFVAQDSLGGYLYDLGRYPGLVLSATAVNLVQGEIHRLYDQDQALTYLDAYEGVDLASPEYRRKLCRTQNGFYCWVYEFMPNQEIFPLIPSGEYNAYYPTNSHHLAFIQRSDASTSN